MIELLPHQKKSVEWLVTKKHALLAHEMRVGKSAICVSAIDHLNLSKVLVIAPAIACDVWREQFSMFSEKIWGSTEFNSTLTITSYDKFVRMPEQFSGSWDVVICDEAHYLKNPNAKRTKLILGKKGILHHTKYFWALTGTPMPNNASELWALLFNFGITTLPYRFFVREYCNGNTTPWGYQITGTKEEKFDEIKQMLSKIMLRYKRSDVILELPQTVFEDVLISPSEVDLSSFKHLAHESFPPLQTELFFKRIEREREMVENAINTTGLGEDGCENIGSLWASTSSLRQYTGVQKITPVVELITDELLNHSYEKIILFAHHADVINGLREGLRKFKPVLYYGKTPEAKKRQNLKKFKGDEKCRVLVANIQACGVAVDLSHCNQIMFVEQDWVPGNNAQAAARCHTIHNKQTVFIRIVSITGTFDRRIAIALKRKMKEALQIVG